MLLLAGCCRESGGLSYHGDHRIWQLRGLQGETEGPVKPLSITSSRHKHLTPFAFGVCQRTSSQVRSFGRTARRKNPSTHHSKNERGKGKPQQLTAFKCFVKPCTFSGTWKNPNAPWAWLNYFQPLWSSITSASNSSRTAAEHGTEIPAHCPTTAAGHKSAPWESFQWELIERHTSVQKEGSKPKKLPSCMFLEESLKESIYENQTWKIAWHSSATVNLFAGFSMPAIKHDE